jgi:hypothetical protein
MALWAWLMGVADGRGSPVLCSSCQDLASVSTQQMLAGSHLAHTRVARFFMVHIPQKPEKCSKST